jgi:hypothetical protein
MVLLILLAMEQSRDIWKSMGSYRRFLSHQKNVMEYDGMQ